MSKLRNHHYDVEIRVTQTMVALYYQWGWLKNLFFNGLETTTSSMTIINLNFVKKYRLTR